MQLKHATACIVINNLTLSGYSNLRNNTLIPQLQGSMSELGSIVGLTLGYPGPMNTLLVLSLKLDIDTCMSLHGTILIHHKQATAS